MRKSLIALMLAALTHTACVKEQVVGGTRAGVGPALVVEQFMRAVNAKDLATMGRLFGTRDGPVSERDDRRLVEQRMFTIASVLQHEDFEIAGEQLVPGRTDEATQLMVRVKAQNQTNTVPFVMVRYKTSNWLIEQIGIDVITRQR